MFEKILALYDFSFPSQRGIAWAVRLACAFRSELQVVTVMGREEKRLYPGASAKELEDLIRRDVDRHLRRVLDKENVEGIRRFEVRVSSGSPDVALLKRIEKEKPDLVTAGSHGRTGLSRVLMGSVAERVARYSPSPVLIARTDPAWPPARILVPLDFSESDEETLRFATDLRSAVPAEIDLLHVLSFREMAGALYPEAVAAWSAGEKSGREKDAEGRIREAAARHPSLGATPLVAVGSPVSEILDKARGRAADLILVATRGRTGLPRLLTGSVAEQVIRYAPCSVLSFSPKESAKARREAAQELVQAEEADLAEYGDGDCTTPLAGIRSGRRGIRDAIGQFAAQVVEADKNGGIGFEESVHADILRRMDDVDLLPRIAAAEVVEIQRRRFGDHVPGN